MTRVYSPFVLDGKAIRNRPANSDSHLIPVFANDDESLRENIWEKKSPIPDESPLKACDGEPWGAHFHAWLGRSKRRYIFSVFPVDHQLPLSGLPEFSQGIALAVAHDRTGRRICRSIFPFSWSNGAYLGRSAEVEAAVEGGTREWHVHLLARTLSESRTVLDDLRHVLEHCVHELGDDFQALPERRGFRHVGRH